MRITNDPTLQRLYDACDKMSTAERRILARVAVALANGPKSPPKVKKSK